MGARSFGLFKDSMSLLLRPKDSDWTRKHVPFSFTWTPWRLLIASGWHPKSLTQLIIYPLHTILQTHLCSQYCPMCYWSNWSTVSYRCSQEARFTSFPFLEHCLVFHEVISSVCLICSEPINPSSAKSCSLPYSHYMVQPWWAFFTQVISHSSHHKSAPVVYVALTYPCITMISSW